MPAAVALLLSAVSGAAAATPRQIAKDLADNGRLDGKYTVAELRAAQRDLTTQGYGSPRVRDSLETAVRGAVRRQQPKQQSEDSDAPLKAVGRSGGNLPFTGLDLALLVGGGLSLLLLGGGLRRLARRSD